MRLRRISTILLAAACAMVIASACSKDAGESATGEQLGAIDTPNPAGMKVGPAIGQLAPNFRLEYTQGGTVVLSDLRGKPVLLNFFATWCGPCRSEMPDLQEVAAEMGGRLTVLGIDLDESKGEVSEFLADLGVAFPAVIDRGENVWRRYSGFGVPSSFILDAEGVVRAVRFGPFENTAEIRESLAKAGLGDA